MRSDDDPYDDANPTPPDERRRSWHTHGTIYLLHFSRPLAHARHYLGFAQDHVSRVAEHQAGNGAALTRAAHRAGIEMRLVRTWEGNMRDERALKGNHNLRLLCPECAGGLREEARLRMRRHRERKKRRAAGWASWLKA